jgi:hypothetical protein
MVAWMALKWVESQAQVSTYAVIYSSEERPGEEDYRLTATLRLRHSWHAPSLRIKAARSLEACDKGPVRLLLVPRMLEYETSQPSRTG